MITDEKKINVSNNASQESYNRLYLTKNDRIENCENNLVSVFLSDGSVLERLEPRRLFPTSRADSYITFLDADGKEICVVRELSDLDAASRRVVRDSLDDYYLVPHILRILSASEKYGTLRWTVETDRGIKSFDIRNRNHDIRVFPDCHVRVRDSDDNRYVIDDYRALDPHSKSCMIADL